MGFCGFSITEQDRFSQIVIEFSPKIHLQKFEEQMSREQSSADSVDVKNDPQQGTRRQAVSTSLSSLG